jgi:hypothetical protein
MPDWLAEYRPELWVEDLDDPLQVYYFGRFPWTAACEEWLRGGNPQPMIKSPRLVQRGSVNTSSVSGDPLGGSLPIPLTSRKGP